MSNIRFLHCKASQHESSLTLGWLVDVPAYFFSYLVVPASSNFSISLSVSLCDKYSAVRLRTHPDSEPGSVVLFCSLSPLLVLLSHVGAIFRMLSTAGELATSSSWGLKVTDTLSLSSLNNLCPSSMDRAHQEQPSIHFSQLHRPARHKLVVVAQQG